MLEINYTLTLGAMLIGLASSVHCVGMCGGIIGALSYSLPADIRENNLKRFAYVTSYNLGRLISYSAMGLLAGLLGAEVFNLLGAGSGHFVMRLTVCTWLAGFRSSPARKSSVKSCGASSHPLGNV